MDWFWIVFNLDIVILIISTQLIFEFHESLHLIIWSLVFHWRPIFSEISNSSINLCSFFFWINIWLSLINRLIIWDFLGQMCPICSICLLLTLYICASLSLLFAQRTWIIFSLLLFLLFSFLCFKFHHFFDSSFFFFPFNFFIFFYLLHSLNCRMNFVSYKLIFKEWTMNSMNCITW